MFKFESKIRYSELDETGFLAVPKLVDYFQDCSNFQSDFLGLGREFYEQRHLAWVLSFWQIVIERRPKQGEQVWTATFPYEFKGFMGGRNFFMQDEDGEILAKANSIWTLLDMDTARPARVTEDILSRYPLEEKLPMEYASRKVEVPKEGQRLEPVRIGREHIDTNGHVNNARYISIAMNVIPCHLQVKEIRIEYKRQAYFGDFLYPFVASIEQGIAVSLTDEQGIAYVNMHIYTISGG